MHMESRSAAAISFAKNMSGEWRVEYTYDAGGLRSRTHAAVAATPGLCVGQILNELGLVV